MRMKVSANRAGNLNGRAKVSARKVETNRERESEEETHSHHQGEL